MFGQRSFICWRTWASDLTGVIDLVATIDLGGPFVKVCYFIEGDGLLALDCYVAIDTIRAAIPNVRATVEHTSA